MKMNKKSILMLASLVLLLTFVIGGTLAWIVATTNPIENKFDPVEVEVAIREGVDGNVKSDVYFTNTGDIPAYIRATVAVYWMYNNEIVPQPAGAKVTGMVVDENSGWKQVGDIYYYEDVVNPYVEGQSGGTTSILFDKIIVTGLPEGYSAKLDVFAEAIQADPAGAVENAWLDVNVVSGKLVAATN